MPQDRRLWQQAFYGAILISKGNKQRVEKSFSLYVSRNKVMSASYFFVSIAGMALRPPDEVFLPEHPEVFLRSAGHRRLQPRDR